MLSWAHHAAHSARQQPPSAGRILSSTGASELHTIALSWVRGQSNLLGVAPWNPRTGDVHPCPEGPSGDHIQCCHPLRQKLLQETSPRVGELRWLMQDGTFPESFSDVVFAIHHSPHCFSSNTKQHLCLLNNDLYKVPGGASKWSPARHSWGWRGGSWDKELMVPLWAGAAGRSKSFS